MGRSSELPRGWNPDTDSLQDLVQSMFDDDHPDAVDADADTAPSPTPAGPAAPARPTTDGPARPPATSPGPASSPGRLRFAVPALAAAILLALGTAGWQIAAAATGASDAATAGGSVDAAAAAPTPAPVVVAPAPTPAPAPLAAPTPVPAPAVPDPIGMTFGARANLGDGWRLAASRPYPCDVLMVIPVLQQPGTRIVRVTLTLTNRTDGPQRASSWQLAASADGRPAELVLWPAERFRGVPDVTLAPRRSVRFLVAVRIPDRPTQLEITASRDAQARAVLFGAL